MPQTNRTVKGVLGGLLGLVGLSAVAGLLVTAAVTPVLAMTGITGSQALKLFDELPSNLNPSQPMEQSRFWATGLDGQPFKLATVYEQNRIPLTFEQVSPHLFDAVLSSEDKSFYSHGGVNLGATVKAFVDNVKGTSSRGASTISQQYVKNVLIQECEQTVVLGSGEDAYKVYADELAECWNKATNATGAEGIQRKLQEMRYAIQIEKDYSKNDILLGYLNIANFGGTVYGIEAAANYYFTTTAANLTIAQAATIAGMVQNPNTYRIDRPEGTWTDKNGVAHNSAEDGYADTKDRRHYVLGRMLEDGKITKAEYDEADSSDIVPAIQPPTQGCAAAGRNAYFCQYAKSIIENDAVFGETPEDRRMLLRRGGLDIYTSLDLRIQNPAAESMANIVPANYDNQHFGAAGVSIEATTGRVLAITQNTIFSETVTGDQAYSSLVYAADEAHNGGIGFPVGSTYKVFTLIDWLEKGHSVREVLNGRYQTLKFKASCEGGAVKTLNTKEIGNFGASNSGRVGTVLEFTRDSLNSGYFAMASKLDLCDINKVAKRLGVTYGDRTENDVTVDGKYPNDPYPSVLGSKNISPLAMAGAYATIANGGTYCTPRAIDRVVQNGKDLPVPPASCSQVLDPAVAATAAYALQGVMAGGGTGREANPGDGTPLIGKTGTHQRHATMMIESSTKVTSAVWVGRTDGTADIYQIRSNGYELNKMRYPLARDMQRAANAAYGGDAFPKPDDKLTRQVLTDVPNVVGKSVDEASKILEDAGFSSVVGPEIDSDQPAGAVGAQDPAGQAPSGTTVTLSPSNGQGTSMPNVVGQRWTDAQNILIGSGFTNWSFSSSCKGNATVESTDPPPGTATNKSRTIAITCD